jgi:limonene-1,2-epoxide hydrolase
MKAIDMTQHTEARRVVEQFIKGVNERNGDAVRAFASPHIQMTFPGGIVIRSVEAFFDWLAGRSPRSVYEYDVIDIVALHDRTVAYASGRAEGVTVSGVDFAGVRVMDKFVIQDGRVIVKEAWSDMADFMRQAASPQMPSASVRAP